MPHYSNTSRDGMGFSQFNSLQNNPRSDLQVFSYMFSYKNQKYESSGAFN
jgi:hypothetical protein